jgi:hypothetical protein
MNIDLSQHELDLLDEALIAWQSAPSSEGSSQALMGAILGGITREDDSPSARANAFAETKALMEKARQESKSRERTALLLRAKLAQASARASEHEIPNPPPLNRLKKYDKSRINRLTHSARSTRRAHCLCA